MEVDERKRKRECEDHAKYVLEKVMIPSNMVGLVIETFSSIEQRSEEVYGVRAIPQERGEVVLRGPSNRIDAAREDFIENLPREYSYPIERSSVEWIQCYQEKAIQELRRQYRVGIRFTGSNVIVLGTKKECCEKVLGAILLIARKAHSMRW